MEPFQAVILGIIQGLTEFLPVSSSGHLVLFQNLLNLKEPELFFDISVHVGTLMAIIVVFFKEIRAMIAAIFRLFFSLLRKESAFSYSLENPEVKLAFLIVVGSVPTAILGLLLHQFADKIFSSISLVGGMLLITGLVIWCTRWPNKDSKGVEKFSAGDALGIGLVQGLAVMPGLSRSGSTIAVGLFLGLNRETAARYSFLLSIPAILGAEILSLGESFGNAAVLDQATLLGAFTSFVVGYAALRILLRMVKQGHLHYFAPYCWVVGIATLMSGW